MKSIAILVILAGSAAAQQAPTPTPPARHEERVVVTGSYSPVPLEETDRAVSVIDVGQSPAEFRNWADVLTSDPSLDVQQRAAGVSADLSVRGYTFEETLILVNGLRLNDTQTGHNNLDIPFPFESVQRVEVLKGAGSTLYGSDAMGGAVNFITTVPETSEVRLGTAGGNFGADQENGALTLARRRFSEQLSFVRERSTGFIADRDYRNLAVASETRVNTALGASDILLGLSDRPFGAAGFYGVPAVIPSWERTKGWLAAWSQPFGTQTSADFAYRRHTDEYIYVKPQPALYENNHLTEDYQAALRRYDKLGDAMRLYYGADALHEHINSTNLGIHSRDQGGFYAALDARALRRFSFNLGAREELYTRGQQVFSPSASGAYWLSSRIKLRASASHAFRLPDFTELDYHDPVHTGNANLKPEHTWSYEGGAQYVIAQRLTVEGDVFYHRDREIIDYVRPINSAPGTPYTAGNIQKLNFTGAEIVLRWQPAKGQRVELAYTGIHSSGSLLKNYQYLYAFNFPSNDGQATWWARLPGGFDSRFRVQAVQRYGTDVYPLVELMVARDFRCVKPYVQLTNLTNASYQEIAGVQMPGRGVIAGVEVKWKAK